MMPTMPCAGRSPGREPHRELILQNQPSAADTTDLPPIPQGGADAAWARVASDLKTVQQQALATQRAIDQLQAQQDVPSHATVWPVSMALPAVGWGLAGAFVLVVVVLLAWRPRRRPVAAAGPADRDSIASDFADDPISMVELHQPVQEDEVSQWATQSETEDDLVSDWGSIPLVRQDPATTFDLEAATSEVTRVRKTLAERRHERALQHERDALLRREAAMRAEDAALVIRLQDVARRGSWVPDLDLSQDIDADATAAPAPASEPTTEPTAEPAPAPRIQTPLAPAPIQSEIPSMTTYALESEPVEVLLPAPIQEPDTTPQDTYAVKLALAHESEAIELWAEAYELAEEVLASPDSALRAQAQATLQRLAVKMQGEEEGVQAAPQLPEPPPEPQQDVYAVKLALARESEAVELWDEARELAEEVLASPDPALTAQARDLITEIQQKLDAIAQDSMPFDPAMDIPNKPTGR